LDKWERKKEWGETRRFDLSLNKGRRARHSGTMGAGSGENQKVGFEAGMRVGERIEKNLLAA